MAGPLAIAAILLLAGCGGGHAVRPAPFADDLGAATKALHTGNLNAAHLLLQRAVALQPKNAVAHYDLGVVYESEHDKRGAFAEYEAALRIAPDFPSAQYNEAVLEAPINAPLAEYLYRRIIAEKPTAATAYLNLGLLQLADSAQAAHANGRKLIAQAVRLEPSLAASVPASLRTSLPAPPTTTPSTP